MAEKTATPKKPHQGKIPDEAREHAHAAREEFRKSFEGLFPPEFREHHRKARKEMLLAWRSMIDASLERMDNE
jgi:hypothetical protein